MSLLLVAFAFSQISAQVSSESHTRIRAAMAERSYLLVASELRNIESKDPEGFKANNYDYLSARMSERTGDVASAMAAHQGVVNRGSVLKPYALWHLSRLARASGNLTLERVSLQELLSLSPDSLLVYPAARRMAQSWFDSGSFDLAIRQIEQMPKPPTQLPARAAEQASRDLQAFLANAYLRAGNIVKAKELFTSLTTNLSNPAQPDDFALAGALALDNLETPESASQLAD